MATRSPADNVIVNVVGELARETGESSPKAAPGTPFRVAVLGDFSGRGNRALTGKSGDLSKWPVHPIDRDNFSEVFSRLKVELRLSILERASAPVVVRFTNLDDFHPDRLLKIVEIFDSLKETREGLQDPTIIAAIETQSHPHSSSSEPSSFSKETEPASNLLEQILGATEEQAGQIASRATSDLDRFIKETVTPYSSPKASREQAELTAKVDNAIAALMRKILHHPFFQDLEAAWRGLHFLVSRLETDESLKIYLIDISKADLIADLRSAEDISASGLYKLLVEQAPENSSTDPWSVLAANFTFDWTDADIALLSRIALLAKAAGAPFVAAAHPHFVGCESLAETPDPDDWRLSDSPTTREIWAALRKLPEAAFIGLALPRFLLRLPYGKETEPIESFDFEEMETLPLHEQYLWGNPSYACVCLIAQAFSQYGWEFRPGMIQEISGLPLHVYKEQNEARVKPCAEALLTQRAAEAVLDRGLMPLLSFLHQDDARLARFQSIADPPSPLLGRWR